MTLKVIHRLQGFSSAICRTFVQHFTRFQLTMTTCSRRPSAISGLLVFISEVALLWKKDYFRKTTCDCLCGYDAAFVKLVWPLVIVILLRVWFMHLYSMECLSFAFMYVGMHFLVFLVFYFMDTQLLIVIYCDLLLLFGLSTTRL